MSGLAVMVWTWPWLLAGVAAVAGPWLAHRMRRRPVARRRFAALGLLRQAMADDSDRDLRRRRWLLGLRTGAVLLLVFAFARPVWLSQGAVSPGQGVDRVFVLDASASMGTLSEGVSLFRRAQDEALAELQQLNPATDRVALVLAGPSPESGFAEPVHDFGQMRRRIEQSVPTEAHADFPAALDRAAHLLRRGEAGRSSGIVVWTDGQISTWKSVDPAFLSQSDAPVSLSIRTLDAGRVVQYAVHDLSVSPVQPVVHRPVRITAQVIQHAPVGADVLTARLRLDQRVVAQTQVHLGEQGLGQAMFDVRFSAAGDHRVSIELDADALAVDNRVQRVITVRDRPVVGLVGSGAVADQWAAALVPRIDAPGAPAVVSRVDRIDRSSHCLASASDADCAKPRCGSRCSSVAWPLCAARRCGDVGRCRWREPVGGSNAVGPCGTTCRRSAAWSGALGCGAAESV